MSVGFLDAHLGFRKDFKEKNTNRIDAWPSSYAIEDICAKKSSCARAPQNSAQELDVDAIYAGTMRSAGISSYASAAAGAKLTVCNR